MPVSTTRLHEICVILKACLLCVEPDPCLDALLNYCSRDAVCVMLGGAFSCQCPVGYRDESLNSDVISGEICTRK